MQDMTAPLPFCGARPAESQISSWESGESRLTWAAVRRYEQLLRRPERQLAAAIDLTARAGRPFKAEPWLRRPQSSRDLASCTVLLDRAEGGDALSGSDWDNLSAGLVSSSMVLLSTYSWRRLIRRGMAELSAALGLAYVLRFEALARIAAHPPAVDAFVNEVRALVDEPGSPVFSEAISLLRFSPDHRAARLLQDLIETPRNPLVLAAALSTQSARSAGTPTGPPPPAVGRQAMTYLQDAPYRVRRASADLLLAIPEDARHTLAARLTGDAEDQATAAILTGSHPVSTARRAELTAFVFTELAEQLGRDLHDDVEMQRRMQIMLGNTNEEIRQQTLLVLMLSPLRSALAGALAQALTDADDRHDLTMMHEALRPLTCLCQPAQLDLMTQLATREPVEPGDREVAAEAAWVLGNIVEARGPAAAARDDALVAALAGQLGRPHAGALPHALLYALALRGQTHRVLPLVGANAAMAAEVHWWVRRSGIDFLGAVSGGG